MAIRGWYSEQLGWVNPRDREDGKGVFRLFGDEVPFVGSDPYCNWGGSFAVRPGSCDNTPGHYIELGSPWTIVKGPDVAAPVDHRGTDIPDDKRREWNWAAMPVLKKRAVATKGVWQGRMWLSFDDNRDDDGCPAPCEVEPEWWTVDSEQRRWCREARRNRD